MSLLNHCLLLVPGLVLASARTVGCPGERELTAWHVYASAETPPFVVTPEGPDVVSAHFVLTASAEALDWDGSVTPLNPLFSAAVEVVDSGVLSGRLSLWRDGIDTPLIDVMFDEANETTGVSVSGLLWELDCGPEADCVRGISVDLAPEVTEPVELVIRVAISVRGEVHTHDRISIGMTHPPDGADVDVVFGP